MLAARPIPNKAARVEEEGGRVVIYVKKAPGRRGRRVWRRIMPTRDERRFTLDPLGADCWRLCDGQRTVEEIVDRFAERHGLSFHESRVAVTGYLKQLIQRAILAIALATEGE